MSPTVLLMQVDNLDIESFYQTMGTEKIEYKRFRKVRI